MTNEKLKNKFPINKIPNKHGPNTADDDFDPPQPHQAEQAPTSTSSLRDGRKRTEPTTQKCAPPRANCDNLQTCQQRKSRHYKFNSLYSTAKKIIFSTTGPCFGLIAKPVRVHGTPVHQERSTKLDWWYDIRCDIGFDWSWIGSFNDSIQTMDPWVAFTPWPLEKVLLKWENMAAICQIRPMPTLQLVDAFTFHCLICQRALPHLPKSKMLSSTPWICCLTKEALKNINKNPIKTP